MNDEIIFVDFLCEPKTHPRYGFRYREIEIPTCKKKKRFFFFKIRVGFLIHRHTFKAIDISDAAKILKTTRKDIMNYIQEGQFKAVFQKTNGIHKWFLLDDEVTFMRKWMETKERLSGILKCKQQKEENS